MREKILFNGVIEFIQCDPKFMSRTMIFLLPLQGKLEGRKLYDWTSILHPPVLEIEVKVKRG